MARIFHISDFHIENENLTFNKRNIIEALIKDIESHYNENSIIAITGDLIDKGAKLFSDKENAFNFFENSFITPLLKKIPNLKGRIFIVPGNHDIDRNSIDEISETGLKKTLKDEEALNKFIKNNRENSIHLARIDRYKKWEKDFYQKYNNISINNFDNTFAVLLPGLKIGISCFNSSWLCKDEDDFENILLGSEQIENSLSQIKDCSIKIALIHHDLEFFSKFDREIVKNLIYKNYNALFIGHSHELSSTYVQDLLGDLFISIANSTNGENPKERKYINGYSIIDIFPNDKIVSHYRKYIENHYCFVPNTDIGTENGQKTFQLLKDDKLLLFNAAQQIVIDINTRHSEKLDDHVIFSNKNTGVDCSINNLFIEPRMLNNPNNSLKESETIKYTIDSILTSSDNYLIYGLKESGKTILLDKMFLDSIQQFHKIKKIPILFKFYDLTKKDILKLIREFVGVTSKYIDLFLQNNDIVIFIDDVCFNSKSAEVIKSLKEFITIYNRVQLVMSSSLILDNIIPTEYIEHNDVFRFNIVFIQHFSTNEIKQLISKWYHGKEIDLHDNMQKLIKSFTDFGLPQTPLSVILFLWIFERQERKPINNSVLVELFIENILEKTNIENIYSETFDFTNKKRLLSFVAKHMNEKGNPDDSYSMDYINLLQFISDYLKPRFTGQPQKVLDDFIKRGIFLMQDDNFIRFRSAFFFHYFLALQFNYNPEFKNQVFSNNNYLNYIDEISYYTGLKRDDKEILLFTQERLDEVFGELSKDIRNNHEKLDRVLEARKNDTVAFHLDDKKIQHKLSDEQIEHIYDQSLNTIPIQKEIPKKDEGNLNTQKYPDKILKLAANVLKNSEDIDEFEIKKMAYDNTLLSSISFLIKYRDALLHYYIKYKKEPDHFPKNINFHIFIKVLPMIHQVMMHDWLGTPKLRPIILDKIERDKTTLNVSEYEKFISVFLYGDIKGVDYPQIINNYVGMAKSNYIKDLSFMKVISYYHLRKNTKELDQFYLKLLANIKEDLGQVDKIQKYKFIKKLEEDKKSNK